MSTRNNAKRRKDVKEKDTPEVVIEEKNIPRPALGILLERSVSHADKVLYNLFGIVQQGWPLIRMNYGRTDLVRNKMALHLLKSDFTHLIMLDIDHVHPMDIVQRLMNHFIAHPELKVVGGLNFRRGAPYDPCGFIQGDDGKFYPMSEWEPGLVKVDAIGTGSIAIAREVFEQLEPPWFFLDYSKVMDDVWPGEDMGFSQLCRDAGISMYVDSELTSPHLIDAVVDENSYRLYIKEKGLGSISLDSIKKDVANE